MKKSSVGTLLVGSIPIVFLSVMVFAPLWAMLRHEDSWAVGVEVLQDEYFRWRIEWTLIQALATVALTVVLGVPVAWVLARWDFWGRNWVLRLLPLPFVMPTLVVGVGVLALFGERGWLWRGWADTGYLLLYGNVFFNLPVVIRATHQGLMAVPASRLNAVRSLGANVWQRFWWVEFPVLKNSLAGGACLVFLYCFSGFGLALLLGGQRYASVEVEIYQLVAFELDMARASVLVWVVLAMTALAGAVYAWIGQRTVAIDDDWLAPEPVRSVGACVAVLLAMLLAMLVLVGCCVLPLLAVCARAMWAGDSWWVLLDESTLLAVYNSLRFSVMAVAVAGVLGLCHAVLAKQWAWFRALSFLPFMVSPICLAFGVLLLYPDWVASLPLLVAMYALLAYPFVTKDVLAQWDNLPSQYADVARVFGANAWQVWWWVRVPLLKSAFRRGLTLSAATCAGEFAASLFLSRPEWLTLSTLIYRYFGTAGADNLDRAAILTVVLMLVATLAFVLLDSTDKYKSNP